MCSTVQPNRRRTPPFSIGRRRGMTTPMIVQFIHQMTNQQLAATLAERLWAAFLAPAHLIWASWSACRVQGIVLGAAVSAAAASSGVGADGKPSQVNRTGWPLITGNQCSYFVCDADSSGCGRGRLLCETPPLRSTSQPSMDPSVSTTAAGTSPRRWVRKHHSRSAAPVSLI